MIKISVCLCVLLVSIVSAEIFELENNFIDYRPAQSIPLPYPYQAIEPVQPVYNSHHANIIVPAQTEVVEMVQSAGFISTAISCTFNVIKSAVVFLLSNVPGLIAGSAVALGLCKITSLCDNQITIYEAQTELRSLATPERLSRAANFVKEAVMKYNNMQNN